jgi:hypothetical protein
MPKKQSATNSANLMVNVFDGTRKPLDASVKVLIRIIDGKQHEWYAGYRKGANHYFKNLPVFNNFGDNYTVIVWAEGYRQAGFTPIKIAQGVCAHIDLMLLPEKGVLNFRNATWDAFKSNDPLLFNILCSGSDSEGAARERYDLLKEDKPETIASFLNIVTVLKSTNLPQRTPLDYFKELIWDEMKQDRFYAFADRSLITQVEIAAAQGQWRPEAGSAFFHAGATKSFKQVQFGEANIQLTFHEADGKRIDGMDCVKVESDMDYYKDVAAHTFLEVIPNALTGRRTDPAVVYVLRWIAGRQAGIPEFDPPYVIVDESVS